VAALAAGADFKSSGLFRILRKSNGNENGRMPQSPEFVFDGPTLNRIAAWAEAGAKDD
jgi:hypothetical protein